MPQMAPISWLLLFFTFSAILFLFNAINFFVFLPHAPQAQDNLKINQNPLTWKW
uniref:ATP synthase complex subunit 8 n=1 Tax=Paragnetina indentata TaxID=2810020 RepID=A0A890CID7_9NEOP|nr:ATP synthase F0 subunit 8 [Paragnetina indentata]QRG31734.1 ATP synthase F0 subunit 8 [Paragnetina indentata]